MVSFNRLRAPKDYSSLPENQEVGNSKWNRNKVLGKVAAVTALAGISLGLFTADNNNRIENTAAPEMTQVTDSPVGDMQGFVQLEGDSRYAFLVEQRPLAAIQQELSPDFRVQSLSEVSRANIDNTLRDAADFLSKNENAKITIVAEGSASDEDYSKSVGGDANLGKESEDNIRLAEQRRDVAYERTVEYLQGFGERVTVTKGDAYESLLSGQDYRWIAATAGSRGLSSERFMNLYNGDKTTLGLTDEEAQKLSVLIDENRGAKLKMAFNKSGIDPESDAVILKQVAPTQELKANPEMSNGNALKLLPVAGAVIAAAGLAVFARRRMKAKKYPATEQVHEEMISERKSVDAYPQNGVATDPLAKKIDWVMDRSRIYNSLKLDDYLYIGKHRRISKKKIKIGAAVATIAAVAGLTAKPSWSTVIEPVIPISKEPVYPLDESKLSYAKKSIFQFRFGRRFVYDEQPVRNPHHNHEQVSRPNVFMFDTEGNLLQ